MFSNNSPSNMKQGLIISTTTTKNRYGSVVAILTMIIFPLVRNTIYNSYFLLDFLEPIDVMTFRKVFKDFTKAQLL